MKINLSVLLLLIVFLSGCKSSNISSLTENSSMSMDSSGHLNEYESGSPSSSGSETHNSTGISFVSDISTYCWEMRNPAIPSIHTLVLSDKNRHCVVEIDFYSQEGWELPIEQTYSALSLDEANRLYNAIVFEGEEWSLIEGHACITLYMDRNITLFTTSGSVRFTSGGVEVSELVLMEHDEEGYIEGSERIFSGFIDLKRMEKLPGFFVS